MLTTTLRDVGERPSRRTHIDVVDGARVTYLATPLRYRWMGVTPTLPLALRRAAAAGRRARRRLPRPGHDGVAAWCRARSVPYVFEPVGMFRPRLRKVRLKRALDATLARGVAAGARARDRLVAARARRRRRGRRRPRARPPARERRSRSRRRRRTATRSPGSSRRTRPSSLYVGRIAAEKGIEHLLEAARRAARRARRARRAGRPPRDDGDGARARSPSPRSAGASTCFPRRPGRRTTSTGVPTSSCSPPAARTSGSSPPRRPRSGRPSSSPTAAASPRRSREGEALVVPYDEEATVAAITRVLDGRRARGRRSSAGALAAAAAHRAGTPSRARSSRSTARRSARRPDARATRRATRDEVLDARLVAPAAHQLARRAGPQLAAERGIGGEARIASAAAAWSSAGTSAAVPAVLEQVEGGADAVGEHERAARTPPPR